MKSGTPVIFHPRCPHCGARAIATEGDSISGFRTRFTCGSVITSEESPEFLPLPLCRHAAEI